MNPLPQKGTAVSSMIMTVDDSPSMRMLLKAALTDMGYNVLEAEDGVDALERLGGACASGNGPDLLITDINMPRLDGFGLIEKVREQDRHRNLPILVLTGKGKQTKAAGGLPARTLVHADLAAAVKSIVS